MNQSNEEKETVLVRHTESGRYLTSDEGGRVVLAPLDEGADADHEWTYSENRITARRTGAVLAVDDENHVVLRDDTADGATCSYRDGQLYTYGNVCLVPGERGDLRAVALPEGDTPAPQFELIPQPRSGEAPTQRKKRPKVKTNEDLKSWMPLVGKVVEGAISGGFSAAGVPGGGLFGVAFSTYWNWFSSQVMNEESVETKMEHVMDWVEYYVYEQISDVVRADIQSSYLTFQESARDYLQAFLNYNKTTDPQRKADFRATLKSKYETCRTAAITILNKCESHNADYADRFILVYTLVMSFYFTLIRDTITNAKELQYPPEEIGPMREALQKRADTYFSVMERILNEIRLLYYWDGNTRKDCHIGKDPKGPTNSRDTNDTLFMIQLVMKIMRSLLYFNPKYYPHNITLTTGSATLSDNGYDAQVRVDPETRILQCTHLPNESVGLVAKLGSEKAVAISMKCAKAHKIGIRVMFATVHSDHYTDRYKFSGEILPTKIKVDGKPVEGTKNFEHKFRLIFDNTTDDNRYFWNRTGVSEGFDTNNYVKYSYLSFGEGEFQPNTDHVVTLPAHSRPVFIDVYFVDWQPDPKPPQKDFIKDTDNNTVDRDNFYYLVSENDSRYLAPDDPSTPTRLVTSSSKPAVQIKFTREILSNDYRTQLKYGDVVLMDFVKKGYPNFKQIPLRINDQGEFGENNPKWFVLTENGLLQLRDTTKKLAKDTTNTGRVILSSNDEANLYWKFEKHK